MAIIEHVSLILFLDLLKSTQFFFIVFGNNNQSKMHQLEQTNMLCTNSCTPKPVNRWRQHVEILSGLDSIFKIKKKINVHLGIYFLYICPLVLLATGNLCPWNYPMRPYASHGVKRTDDDDDDETTPLSFRSVGTQMGRVMGIFWNRI